MTIETISSKQVQTIEGGETVFSAAEKMKRLDVGALVVVDEKRRPTGILTDRDIVIRTVAEGIDPRSVAIRSVMTENPNIIGDDAPISNGISLMRHGGFRRLPVVDADQRVVGMVTMDDVMELLAKEISDIGLLLESKTSLHKSP